MLCTAESPRISSHAPAFDMPQLLLPRRRTFLLAQVEPAGTSAITSWPAAARPTGLEQLEEEAHTELKPMPKRPVLLASARLTESPRLEMLT